MMIGAALNSVIHALFGAPYDLQEDLFYEVALRYGAADATVDHQQCRRTGADACRLEIRHGPRGPA